MTEAVEAAGRRVHRDPHTQSTPTSDRIRSQGGRSHRSLISELRKRLTCHFSNRQAARGSHDRQLHNAQLLSVLASSKMYGEGQAQR